MLSLLELLAPTAALRGKVGIEEAVYPRLGSPGVHPDHSLEPCEAGEVNTPALLIVYVVEKPIDLCYNICCCLGASKESI